MKTLSILMNLQLQCSDVGDSWIKKVGIRYSQRYRKIGTSIRNTKNEENILK